MRPVWFGVALGAAFLGTADARAVDVATGDGIVVIDLTRAETKQVFDAVDSAAAFAELVSPVLPAEYQAAVRLAGGGWALVRMALPKEGVTIRVAITAVPPAMLLLPDTGATAADVVRAYASLREKAGGYLASALRVQPHPLRLLGLPGDLPNLPRVMVTPGWVSRYSPVGW